MNNVLNVYFSNVCVVWTHTHSSLFSMCGKSIQILYSMILVFTFIKSHAIAVNVLTLQHETSSAEFNLAAWSIMVKFTESNKNFHTFICEFGNFSNFNLFINDFSCVDNYTCSTDPTALYTWNKNVIPVFTITGRLRRQL